jgi:hypothetical protein
LDAHAARVDQFKKAVLHLNQGGQTIARNPGSGVNDGDPVPAEPIEQRGLPDIGTANNGYDRNSHELQLHLAGGPDRQARHGDTLYIIRVNLGPGEFQPAILIVSANKYAYLKAMLDSGGHKENLTGLERMAIVAV